MNPNHTPTTRERATTMLAAITALAAGTYIACGDGFTWDPYAYTIAWLLLICALAATIPQADTLIDTVIRAARRMARIPRSVHHACVLAICVPHCEQCFSAG